MARQFVILARSAGVAAPSLGAQRSREALGTQELLAGIASFFNGALFPAATLDVIGVPDLRLFVRGDEVELHRRMVRSGLPFGTCLRAVYLHPNGSEDFKPMLGGRLHAQDPQDPTKRYYTYRNRGYLYGQRGMRLIGALEVFRYGWYFLISKRNPAGFVEWLRLVRQGRREWLARPPKAQSHAVLQLPSVSYRRYPSSLSRRGGK